MNIPFRFRKVPPYVFDGDGMFSEIKIVGFSKKKFRKRQIKRYIKELDKE